MKSIIQKDKVCYICGSSQWIEEHHVFGGANRKLSEKYGLKVYLCHYCHNEPPNGVHHNREVTKMIKAEIQDKAMKRYGWSVEEFCDIFGKSYL